LLIVIVVIGILATVTIIAFNGVQRKAIVASLKTDLSQMNRQLTLDSVENNDSFPDSLEQVNGGRGLDYDGEATLMYTPLNDNDPPDYCLTAVLGDIAYKVTRYTGPEEGYCPGDEPIGIPEAPVIQTSSDSTSQITVSWDVVENADSYIVEYSLSSLMSSPTTIEDAVDTNYAVTSLSPDTTYYFTVKAVSVAGAGLASEIVSETTQLSPPEGAPAIAAAVNSASQITVSWSAVSGASNYRLEYSSSSSFSGATAVNGITATSQAVSGLSAGSRYYFRAYALNEASVESGSSNSVNAITSINAPDSPSVSVSIPGAVRSASSGPWAKSPSGNPTSGNWYYARASVTSSTCASGTSRTLRARIQYSSPQTYGSWTSWTASSSFYAVQPSSPYGIRFQVQSRCSTSLNTSSSSSSGYGCRYRNDSSSCSAW
jgi:hypothetical protein